ncbi:MAG: CBS domain-containing protein [Halieaceae bacterium]|jgi:CBS domain-containing protein
MKDAVVRDHMNQDPALIRQGSPITTVVDVLLSHKITGAPVVDGAGQLVGFVSEHDCIDVLIQQHTDSGYTPIVDDVMHGDVLTASPDDTILSLAEKMGTLKPKNYPVVSGERLLGVISRSDVLRAMCELGR